MEKIRNKRTMYLSGWAIDAGAKFRFSVDEALPLSDHADFPSLLEYVRRVNPKKIFTTHGPADFARQLRSLGYRAELLAPHAQGGVVLRKSLSFKKLLLFHFEFLILYRKLVRRSIRGKNFNTA